MNPNFNPFENESANEEISNPFQASVKNESNINNNNSNFNPYEDDQNNNNNNNNNYNPFENNNTSNPFEESCNNNDNPFENNNANNPFENDFEGNNYNNNNQTNNNNEFNDDNNEERLPSFQKFEEMSSNPYLNNTNINNNNNFNNFSNNNNFNNNQGNNYLNNFGGPSNNNNAPNPFGNNNRPNNNMNNNNQNNPGDAKKIKAIMDTCISLSNQATNQYENFNIKEAIKTLCKAIKGFDGLKQSIQNKKTSFSSLLPKITSLRNKAFSNLQEYRINIYLLINLKFKPVQFTQEEPLLEFTKRYILTEPFISFDDIFDPAQDTNKQIRFVMNDYFKKSQRLGYKNLLLYGPQGAGKTLAVHALASELKGKVAQIEGMELFKIPYFAKEFVKAAFTFLQFKPLIVYIKNMEKMFSNMNNFNFIYDRTSSSKLENVIFIASTTVPVHQLPKEISKKFHYVHCIRPADKSQKSNYIKFISDKIGIKLNMNEQDLNSFAFQYLGNYSNEDIFNLIKTAIDLKKQEIGNDEENRVYKEGLFESEIKNALNSVKGTLTPEIMKNYYL